MASEDTLAAENTVQDCRDYTLMLPKFHWTAAKKLHVTITKSTQPLPKLWSKTARGIDVGP